jgi:hypothetical protein
MRGAIVILLVLAGATARAASFGDDVAFLRKHLEVIVLDGEGGAKIAVVPAWQGRVATSTAAGDEGSSFGWINRELVSSGKKPAHVYAVGGEDRLWLGPEGGQFSIFFRRGDPFDLEHWQTPAAIDTEAWQVAGRDGRSVRFARAIEVVNRAGTRFQTTIERTIRLVGEAAVREACGRGAERGLRWVGYQSENRLANAGKNGWTRAGGLLSIWSMGMFAPSPGATVIVPLAPAAHGRKDVVNDVYFGRVPAERLAVARDAIYFRADGQARGKIGVRPPYARATLGSYDADHGTLTVIWYTLPKAAPAGTPPYVNSLWKEQKDPFAGDVVNSYNDGPPTPGAKALGPFYELETSSPAAELAPGASLAHTHRTIHFVGERPALDAMARACLGVGIAEVEKALPRR